MFKYKYARPALSVDCVVFGCNLIDPTGGLQVLLIKRKNPPFENSWAFPGGFVEMNEEIDAAARRELLEETGLQCGFLEQLYTFGGVDRDPRERVISVAYFALVNVADHRIRAATDASDAKWCPTNSLPTLGFDHAEIMKVAIERLRGKIRYQPVGFELLPERFSLTQLQQLYEIVLERPLDKRNFRKKILSFDILVDCKTKQTGVSHRAANLYRFDRKKYEKRSKQGFNFEI